MKQQQRPTIAARNTSSSNVSGRTRVAVKWKKWMTSNMTAKLVFFIAASLMIQQSVLTTKYVTTQIRIQDLSSSSPPNINKATTTTITIPSLEFLVGLTNERPLFCSRADDLYNMMHLIETNATHNSWYDDSFGNDTNSSIPHLIHQTSKQRCVVQPIYGLASAWKARFPQWNYFFHDDNAMERLLQTTVLKPKTKMSISEQYFQEQSKEKQQSQDAAPLFYGETFSKTTASIPHQTSNRNYNSILFPHLSFVWNNCLQSGAMKADLWRLLVLWTYGGIFSDLDATPNRLSPIHLESSSLDALFVVDKDKTTSFHFMATSRHHTLVYLTLREAIYRLSMAADIRKVNPVETTGPKALVEAISQFLHDTPQHYRNQINYQQHEPVLAGTYMASHLGRQTFRVLGGGEEEEAMKENKENKSATSFDMDYWVNREMTMLRKRRWYRKMNMSHFSDNVLARDGVFGPSCFESILNDLVGVTAPEATAEKENMDEEWSYHRHSISLEELVSLSNQQAKDCPDAEFVHVSSAFLPGTPTFRRIPQILHQFSSTPCIPVSLSVVKSIKEKWSRPENNVASGWSLVVHDEAMMDRLVYSGRVRAFPHLPLVWKNCALSMSIKIGLYRWLILWEYGGVYTRNTMLFESNHHDTTRQNDLRILLEAILEEQHDDYGIFISSNDNVDEKQNKSKQYLSVDFMALAPKHPLVFFCLTTAIHRLSQSSSITANGTTTSHIVGEELLSDSVTTLFYQLGKYFPRRQRYRKIKKTHGYGYGESPKPGQSYHGLHNRSQFYVLNVATANRLSLILSKDESRSKSMNRQNNEISTASCLSAMLGDLGLLNPEK